MRKIEEIIIHCSDSPWGDAEIIEEWHTQRGFNDIGYHVVILNGKRRNSRDYDKNLDGKIDPGRGIDIGGAHCRGHNSHSLGVCLIGKDEFTPKQIYKLKTWLTIMMEMYPEAKVYGHREFDLHKTCPNFNVQEWMREEGVL